MQAGDEASSEGSGAACKSMRSGVWKDAAHMHDYRAEWLGQVFVERASWSVDAPSLHWNTAPGVVHVAGPHYVWFRFWLDDERTVVDKYFDPSGSVVGWYAPITSSYQSSYQQDGKQLSVDALCLGLWIDADNRITVMGETEFDCAIAEGDLTPVQIEEAEYGIRQLCMSISARRFPPRMMRSFAMVTGGEA